MTQTEPTQTMTGTALHTDPATTGNGGTAAKRSAAQASVLAAVGITLLKLLTGILTGSLGMLSEAAHSFIDLIASAVTLMTVRVADMPADEEHNYGHGKLENLSAAFETVLMVASCVWIARASVERMVRHEHLDLRWTVWPFLVLALSMAVDWTRSRSLHRVATAHRSEALEADAVHFGTDIWSSAAVFLGLLAAFAGEKLHVPALEYADPIAALIVAGIILGVTWRLARQTIDSLLDATPPEVREQIRRDLIRDLEAEDGVLAVDRVRVRRSGSNYFVDLTLSLPRRLTFQRSEQITLAATEAVQRLLPGADVVIHTVPRATLGESVFDRVRAVAARSNLSIHDVSVRQYEGVLHVEQHLEVPETMTLREAHEVVTALETAMKREVPEIASLLTHIESEPATIATAAQIDPSKNLENQLRATASHFPEILDIHEISLTRGHGGAANSVQVNLHCTLPDDLPMEAVHEVITNFESEFRLDHPQVARVFIHPEPATDNRR
ncbi:MAG: cation diffusion facilitator family transporter [Acidobacteriaceae bacterium]